MKKSVLALLIVMLFAADSSMAMSLGRYRGTALVGQPLDISVQAVLGTQDDPAALCIEADAFYADNKLDRSQVRVSTEKALSNPLDTLIRIRSSVLVDEPVVTLNVRVGCQQKTERRYVILADLAAEPVGLPLQPSGAGATGLSAPLATRANSPAGASVALAASAGGSNRGSDAVAVGQTTVSRSPEKNTPVARRDKLQASDANASGQSMAGKARLKLEPLDLSIERSPQLKSSTQLLSVPATGEERSAATALWRALQAQPQDVIKDAEKIQSLENSLNTLRVQNQKNQLALNELNSQFDKTRSERYANWLVYALGLLLILALAGLVYLWRLRALPAAAPANALPWWRKNKPLEKGWTNNLPESASPVSPDSASAEDNNLPTHKNKKKKSAKSSPVLLNPDSGLGADQSAFTEVRHISRLGSDSQPSSLLSLDFTVSMPQVARGIKTEELFDIQQQADFFVSLGQYEQAVELLRGHIAHNSQTSPLVYLDLFDLYHQLDRQTDYEALRTDFNQLFIGQVPAFELYTHSSAGLEAYPVALARIEALWPSAKVLEVIEESISRRPVASSDNFDLEAYRELLLLYAVAKELVPPQGSKHSGALQFDLPDASSADRAARISGFSLTTIEPLSANAGESATMDIGLLLPPQSPRLALDVDLDDLMGTTNTPLPGVGMQSNSNSNFFARLGTKIPVGSLARSPAPVAPYVSPAPPAEVDNLINFDDLDDFIKNSDPARLPKA